MLLIRFIFTENPQIDHTDNEMKNVDKISNTAMSFWTSCS